MRVALWIAVLILICIVPARGTNNIMIGLDSVPNYQTEFMVPFLYENDVHVECVSNGFTITAYGPLMAFWGSDKTFATGPRFGGEATLPMVVRTVPDSTMYSDSILAGFFVPWPYTYYLYEGPLEELFSYEVLVSKTGGLYSEGEICIDSVRKVGAAGDWMWDDGDQNLNPTFNNGNGAHCIAYYTPEDLCGDVQYDGKVNISDAVYLISFVFSGGPAPNPYIIGDVNCDGKSNVGDAVYLINYVFKNGSPPCDINRDGIPDC